MSTTMSWSTGSLWYSLDVELLVPDIVGGRAEAKRLNLDSTERRWELGLDLCGGQAIGAEAARELVTVG